jgi:hypothetical protein
MVVHDVVTTGQPADQTASEQSALRYVLPTVVVIVVYLLIGIVAFWPLYPGISQRLFGDDSDFTQSVWFLDWVPHAAAHGLNPFFSNAIFVPTGVNLAPNTASPLLGLISAPFAPVLNPVARTNLLMVLSMPVSATAAFVVLRKWRVWGPGAALGGLIYGFSPYMVGQGSWGHVELLFVPLPPFIAFTVASILQRAGSSRRLGIQLGLLVVAQYLISPEVLATVGLFTFAAVACVAIRRRADPVEMARTTLKPAGVAFVVAAVLLAYPVWMMLAGPQHFTGSTYPVTNSYHNDLLNLLVPGPLQKDSLGMGALGVHLGPGSSTPEVGGYIGVPLLVLTGILVWRSRRRPRTQLTAVLLIGAVLLSLGPHLAVDGHLTDIPLPFLVVDHLPLLDNILPSRISFEVAACIAALIAFGLDDLWRTVAQGNRDGSARRRWVRGREGAVFAGATLAVLVVTQLPQWPYVAANASALPANLRHAVPAGDPVAITYPYATPFSMQPMLWQVEDGFDFRLLGGFAYHPDSNGHPTLWPAVMKPSGLQDFLASSSSGVYERLVYGQHIGPTVTVSPELVGATRASLSRYDVRLVIVDRSVSGSGPVMELFSDALGPPTVSAGPFSMWTDWHGRPRHEVFSSHIVTTVLRPSNDATLSGTTVLDAKTTAWVRVTKVEFLLTEQNHHVLLAGGISTPYGWSAKWNTTSVANGTNSLQSIAYDASGTSRLSKRVPITVKN